ncbi:MAG: DUF447 family protein [Thiobacillus sp.]|uniref:DUF447 domain-containing protein n=1 Tax=Thiobacillus sp. 63-78 TaxID=1895859 RepID=UPI001AC0B668|nr:DUF447 domain-containing protein [Thiobacillus sp. 63-78]MBN8762675.1 DUF447 family protein [Thiobacillus sp.]MBN8774114.1 DUF447 family protein [Thiobacillus sp.]
MSLILEAILTTATPDGGTHIAPLGFRREDGFVVLSPFHPSRTLDNLRATGIAAISHPSDVRVFAGCLTGRRDWPLVPCDRIACGRLAEALSHSELIVERIEEDAVRPRFICREVVQVGHLAFPGHNRAQAAVIEACILASRLDMLPADKVKHEMDYLAIAIDKTAGPRELEAWNWLKEKIDAHRAREQAA